MILHFIDTQFQRTSLGRAMDEEETQLMGTSLGRPVVSQLGSLSTPQQTQFKLFQRTSMGRATIEEDTSLGRPMVSQGLSTPQQAGLKSRNYSELNLDFFLLIYRKPFGIR